MLRNRLRNLGVGHVEKNRVDPECLVCTVCPQKANGDKMGARPHQQACSAHLHMLVASYFFHNPPLKIKRSKGSYEAEN